MLELNFSLLGNSIVVFERFFYIGQSNFVPFFIFVQLMLVYSSTLVRVIINVLSLMRDL